MDRDGLVDHVVDVVRRVMESSGRTVGEIGRDTRPLRDIDDFDSLSGVEATVILSGILGQELPDSVFVPTEGNRTLSITEVADSVYRHMTTGSATR